MLVYYAKHILQRKTFVIIMRGRVANRISLRGAFFKLKITVNELDSNFHQFLIRLRRFSVQNQMISKKKKKKKGKKVRNSERFSVQI